MPIWLLCLHRKRPWDGLLITSTLPGADSASREARKQSFYSLPMISAQYFAFCGRLRCTKLLRCDAHLFWLQGARPPPARRSHAHTRGCGGGRDRRPRRVACGLPSLPHPPLPAPASRAARPAKCAGLCGAHTHSGLPRARGGDEAASTAAKARVRHAFLASRHPLAMPTHTASQLHMAHPAPHIHKRHVWSLVG